MSFRLLLPLICWVSILLLLTIRNYELCGWEVAGIHSQLLVHLILFLGFSHILMGVFKKQLKYERLRQHSEIVVIISGVGLISVVEFTRIGLGISHGSLLWSLIFDIIGVFLGIGTFRLLYRGIH